MVALPLPPASTTDPLPAIIIPMPLQRAATGTATEANRRTGDVRDGAGGTGLTVATRDREGPAAAESRRRRAPSLRCQSRPGLQPPEFLGGSWGEMPMRHPKLLYHRRPCEEYMRAPNVKLQTRHTSAAYDSDVAQLHDVYRRNKSQKH